jgi:hypothetical protein
MVTAGGDGRDGVAMLNIKPMASTGIMRPPLTKIVVLTNTPPEYSVV